MPDGLAATTYADALIAAYPDPDDFPYRPWSYPQGYLAMGMAKLWERTKEPRYLDYVRRYCERHAAEDGSVEGFTGCSMDDMMPASALVWMYERTGESRYALACRRVRDAFRDYPRTREGGFLHNRTLFPGEMWVDGVFMGQMFMCRYGRAFGQEDCLAETVRQLGVIYDYCHAHDGLLRHAYSQDSLASWAEADGRSGEVWSEGLGWYALMLVEALALLPEGFAGRERVERQARELMDGLMKYQCPRTGLWYQVVDKPEAPGNWCDVSGSAMFAYALTEGATSGIADRGRATEALRRAKRGLIRRCELTAGGRANLFGACEGLGVQNTYEDYIRYPQKMNAQEAVCGYLWALTALERLDG